jgi:hypothetical protein
MVGLTGRLEEQTMPRHGALLARALLGSLLLAASVPALADEPAAATPAVAAEEHHERYFGITYGAGAGVLALDLQVSYFYAFLAAPLPLDVFDSDNIVTGVVGAGATIPLPSDRRWHFDVFAYGLPAHTTNGFVVVNSGDPYDMLSFGLGAGFHFTGEGGFTVGFKFPVFGTTVALDNRTFSNVGDRAVDFYLFSILTLPVVSFGYRF